MKRVLIAAGAFIWGIVVFRIALGVHFPTEAIKNRASVEVSKSTNDSMQLKIGDMGLASVFGLKASDSILYTKNSDGESVPSVVVDQLSVVLSPIQTLFGALGLSVDADIMGGNVAVDVSGDSFQPSEMDITGDVTGLDLNLIPINSDAFEAVIQGKLTTHVEGSFPQEKPHKNSEGRFTLSVDGLSISGAKASGIELPALDFSEVSIAGLFKNGKLEITDANIISESIGLGIEGDIILAKVWNRSRLRLTLELKLGSEFSLIAKMLPQLKNNKVGEEDGSGIYKLNVIGTIKDPRIKSNSSRRPSRANRPDTKSIEKNDRPTDTKSPEEKRRERRERIEARKKAQEARKKAGGVDMQDRPMRDRPNRPLSRVPALERDEDMEDEDEDIIEPGDDIIEPGDEEDDGDFEPGQDDDDDINDDEPSDEDE